jgi:chondroitin AC lyase
MNSTFAKFDKSPTWIYHDQIGYYFPEAQNVEVSAQNQPGSWAEINGNSSDKSIDKDIFKLYINHQKNPDNAKYSYIIFPGVDSLERLSAELVSGLEIIKNNEKVQAVIDENIKLFGAVFYEEGTLEWEGISLSVNKPCLVQIQEYSPGKWQVNLAEPTQLLKGSIKVNIQAYGKSKNINFNLPKEDLAGSTVHELIDMN